MAYGVRSKRWNSNMRYQLLLRHIKMLYIHGGGRKNEDIIRGSERI